MKTPNKTLMPKPETARWQTLGDELSSIASFSDEAVCDGFVPGDGKTLERKLCSIINAAERARSIIKRKGVSHG